MGERYKIFEIENKKYMIDKRIFQILLVIVMISAFSISLVYGFDFKNKIWVRCNETTPCMNVIKMEYPEFCGKYLEWDSVLCTEDYLPPGFEYGKKAPWIVQNFLYIVILLVLASFILNHFWHNKEYYKEVEK